MENTIINDKPSTFKDLKALFANLSDKTGLTDTQMQAILENMYYLLNNLGLANIDVGTTETNFLSPGSFSNVEVTHEEKNVGDEVFDFLNFKFDIPTPKIQTEIITNTVTTPDDVSMTITNYPIIEVINGQEVTTGYKFSFNTNLYKGDGIQNNEIVSRETLPEATINSADFVQPDNEELYYKRKNGETYSYEPVSIKDNSVGYTIGNSDWKEDANLGNKYKYKSTLKFPKTLTPLKDEDIVELMNTDYNIFEKYIINATNLTTDSVDIICKKLPTENVKIKLLFSKAKIIKTEPAPTPELVYTLSKTGDYYIVGTGFDSVEAVESATSGGTDGSGLSADWKGGELNIPSEHNGLPVKAIALNAFGRVENITKCYIADGITTIGNGSFQCPAGGGDILMVECRLPKTLKFLGGALGGVFWGRSVLSTIIIPSGITQIADYTFYTCRSLKNIIIPNTVITINYSAFTGCNSLINVMIPDSVRSIGSSAFSSCRSLPNITIPISVGNIAAYAFSNCISLTNITYDGKISQWNAVTKGKNWNYNVPAQVVHCTDGDAPIGGV